jgi:hypothetical protein
MLKRQALYSSSHTSSPQSLYQRIYWVLKIIHCKHFPPQNSEDISL